MLEQNKRTKTFAENDGRAVGSSRCGQTTEAGRHARASSERLGGSGRDTLLMLLVFAKLSIPKAKIDAIWSIIVVVVDVVLHCRLAVASLGSSFYY